jgi:LemA protein
MVGHHVVGSAVSRATNGTPILPPVLVTLAIVLAVAGVVLFNRLVRLRVRVDEAWAQVAAQLQRRHDLVPNLVAVVGGYASHERGLVEAVTSARADALRPGDPEERLAAEDALGATLGRLLAVMERYPDLRADARFRELQDELTATEDRIAFARGFANDRVARYRAAITTFPGVLVARPFGFRDHELFAAQQHARLAPRLPPA